MTTVADLIGADGAAGQPQLLQTAARQLDQAGGEVARLRASLSAVESASWRGQARVRFDKLRDTTVDQDLRPIDDHYDVAVGALRSYGHRLDDIQERARAIAKAMTAEEHKLEANHRDEGLAGGLVSAAKVAATVTTLNPTAKVAAELALKEAKQHQGRMRAQTAATQQRLNKLRGQGSELRAELDQAAHQCAATLGGLRPPAGQAKLTPTEIAAGGAAAVAGGVAAIRRIKPGHRESIPDARQRGREGKLRDIWNSTPAGHATSAADWAKSQVGHEFVEGKENREFIDRNHPNHPWGGAANKYGWSADCILFARTAWEINGVSIPFEGDAISVQHQFGDRIDWSSTAPEGAMVFFPECGDPRGHVAIADGQGGVYTTIGGNDSVQHEVKHLSASELPKSWSRKSGWVLPE